MDGFDDDRLVLTRVVETPALVHRHRVGRRVAEAAHRERGRIRQRVVVHRLSSAVRRHAHPPAAGVQVVGFDAAINVFAIEAVAVERRADASGMARRRVIFVEAAHLLVVMIGRGVAAAEVQNLAALAAVDGVEHGLGESRVHARRHDDIAEALVVLAREPGLHRTVNISRGPRPAAPILDGRSRGERTRVYAAHIAPHRNWLQAFTDVVRVASEPTCVWALKMRVPTTTHATVASWLGKDHGCDHAQQFSSAQQFSTASHDCRASCYAAPETLGSQLSLRDLALCAQHILYNCTTRRARRRRVFSPPPRTKRARAAKSMAALSAPREASAEA